MARISSSKGLTPARLICPPSLSALMYRLKGQSMGYSALKTLKYSHFSAKIPNWLNKAVRTCSGKMALGLCILIHFHE